MIAWLLYGSLEQRTGGTIYDRIVIDGLRARGLAIEVLDPRAPGLLRTLLRASVIVGDELCHPEIAFAFPRLSHATRILLVHHLTCWEGARTRTTEARALRAADLVVTTSEATRARLVSEGYRRRIEVVKPGADRLTRIAGAPCDATRFLFVGTVSQRKRVRELIGALPPNTTLRVVGSMTREKRYAESVRALASPAVAFLGELDEAELAEELASADALVMPSSLEGYGIAAAEAIHAGVPVIAARTPGLEEALSPALDATMFVDVAREPAALAQALHDFSTDHALRTRLRAAATRATLPTWAQAVDGFMKHVH